LAAAGVPEYIIQGLGVMEGKAKNGAEAEIKIKNEIFSPLLASVGI
jgi:hypothetical protein